MSLTIVGRCGGCGGPVSVSYHCWGAIAPRADCRTCGDRTALGPQILHGWALRTVPAIGALTTATGEGAPR